MITRAQKVQSHDRLVQKHPVVHLASVDSSKVVDRDVFFLLSRLNLAFDAVPQGTPKCTHKHLPEVIQPVTSF